MEGGGGWADWENTRYTPSPHLSTQTYKRTLLIKITPVTPPSYKCQPVNQRHQHITQQSVDRPFLLLRCIFLALGLLIFNFFQVPCGSYSSSRSRWTWDKIESGQTNLYSNHKCDMTSTCKCVTIDIIGSLLKGVVAILRTTTHTFIELVTTNELIIKRHKLKVPEVISIS